MRAAIPLIAAGGGGAVINITSIAALVGLPGRAAYSAAMGATTRSRAPPPSDAGASVVGACMVVDGGATAR